MDAISGDGMPSALAYVEVSPEMTAVLGRGPLDSVPLPPEAMALTYEWGTGGDLARVAIDYALRPGEDDGDDRRHRVTLYIQRSAFARVGGSIPAAFEPRLYHLPSTLIAIVSALGDRSRSGESLKVYRLAKSIELLCETIRLEAAGELVPARADSALSSADTRRVVDARRMIDERWSERLTLERIARACGLNRAKLTTGFREVFKCTIAEALSERRLAEARRMLLTTDMPVSCVGYRSGYLNNAAFSRAFSRRFGLPPSSFRAHRAAA